MLPFDLINLIENRYRINAFELTSNDGCWHWRQT